MTQIRVEIFQRGKPPQEVIKDIKLQFIKVDNALIVLGTQARNYMRSIIKNKKRRPDGSRDNLELAIDIEGRKTPTETVVGVGNISFLNKVAPYWKLINYGGLSGIAKAGRTIYGAWSGINPSNSSLRGTGKGTESFFRGGFGGPKFPMKPMSPIEGKNYIEETLAFVHAQWRIHFSGYSGKITVSRQR